MKRNKFLTTIAVVLIALVALFTGCNKSGWERNNLGHEDHQSNGGGHNNGTTTSLVNLGTASTFAVLGGETVTNAGPSVITGDAGVSPGTELTGFLLTNNIQGGGTVTPGLGVVNGIIYAGGPVAAAAHMDAIIAYNYLMAQVPDITYAGVTQLDGLTFTPGVYKFAPSANLAVDGILTLDFEGDPNALFIFQTESTLVTMAGSQVVAKNNDATTCLGSNVFWAVGSSATISGDSFIGTVIALTTITMTNPVTSTANVAGRMLALHGSVTMINSIISTCGTSVGGGKSPKPCKDFVTGGGWIKDKETFGVSGGIKNSKFWGQLSYNNHAGIKVKSTEVTGYTVIDATTREIKGLASVNGEGSFPYTVTVTDKGEPGRADVFTLTIDGIITTSGVISGGNIQLHKECDNLKDDEHHYSGDEAKGNSNCENDHRGGKN